MNFTGTIIWLDRIGSRCVERTCASAAEMPAGHAAAHASSVAAASTTSVTKAAARDDARVASLDTGRALAVVGVILVHLALFMPALPTWLQVVADMGQYGVQLFFVISAVTIMLTLEEDMKRFGDDYSLISRRFYVKRFFRIAPLYYVAIAVYSVGNHLAARFDTQITAAHSIADVVANLVFIHAWVPSAANTVVPGGWSIGVEMCFYLLAPVIFIATRTGRGLWRTSLALLVYSAVAMRAGACVDLVCIVENNSFMYYWPPTQLPCFVVGVLLARYGKRLLLRDGMKLTTFGIACTFAACAVLLALLYATGSGLGLAHWLAPTVAACASAALLLLLAQLPRRYSGARIVAAFGQNSYGLYIWSFVAILIVRVALKTPLNALDHQLPVPGFAIAALFACCASYVAARISAARIERPCVQWARQALLPRKSSADFVRLQTLESRSIDLPAYRYLCLTADYRSKRHFNWASLDGAQTALNRLRHLYSGWPDGGRVDPEFAARFDAEVNEDLNLPRALAVLWELVRSSLPPATLRATVDSFDTVLGLGLRDWKPLVSDIPESIRVLLSERERAREERDWAKADDIRETLSARGWRVEDSKERL